MQGGSSGRALWTEPVRAFVEGQQEKAYRRLADELGLAGDARAAHARLAPTPLSAAAMAPKSRADLVRYSPLPAGTDIDAFNAGVQQKYGDYFDRPPPTDFEDPTRFPLLEMLDDELWAEFGRIDRQPQVRPSVATMPTGDVNARILQVPGIGRPIVFVEQGLFAFLNTMAVVAAWSTPTIRPEALSDLYLATLPGRHTFPSEAPRIFFQALTAYAVDGSVEALGPIPKPAENLFIAMALFAQMQRFALAHELAHLRMGHLGRLPASPQEAYAAEHEADLDALEGIAAIARASWGAWALGFWGAELALTAFNFLDRTLGLLEYGPQKLDWISSTHPQPLERRERLHDAMPASGSELERAAAAGLYRMDQAIFQRLWEIVHLDIYLLHQQGERPSPIWKDRLQRSLSKKV